MYLFSGNVTLEEFIEQVNLLPRETLDQLFTFLIVPNVINEEAHKTFSRLSNHPPTDVIPQVSSCIIIIIIIKSLDSCRHSLLVLYNYITMKINIVSLCMPVERFSHITMNVSGHHRNWSLGWANISTRFHFCNVNFNWTFKNNSVTVTHLIAVLFLITG